MGRPRLDVAERIRRRTVVDPDTGCWEWQGAKGAHGYGRIRVTDEYKVHRVEFTHRAAYVALVGPIPDGLVIDHLCRNRICCNPDHLEPVTQAENLIRSDAISNQFRDVTHCVHGHEFTPENTYYGKKGRFCRACRSRRSRESYLRKKAREAANG